MRGIEFYRTASGRSPVEEFLDGLTDKHAQKVTWTFRMVEQLTMVPPQYFKKLAGTEEIWEIRVHFVGLSTRFLGFYDGPTLIIVTNAFSKKDQKTPARELRLAEDRRRDHLRRKQRP